MKKATEKLGESKPDVDKAKRVYRAALDAIKKLDEILKQKKAYRDVFLQDAVGLRNKLKEYCERLMFYNPVDYGRKAEEVLWRKVFYDPIQLVKKNRRHLRSGSSLEAAFRTHLSSATGYYHHLIFRLQSEFGLKLHRTVDFFLIPESKSGHKKSLSQAVRRRDATPAVQDWATKACHRCLVCLGDIARYQQEFDKGVSKAAAERFYHQAIALYPDNGMPHNQLGTLKGSRYFQCEAAYHYIRCMVCEKAFDGAEGNLDRLFEKNRKRYRELQHNSSQSLPPKLQRQYDVKFFLIHFIHLLDVFFDTNRSVDAVELQECCQSALQSFNLCMFYEPVVYAEEECRDENLQYLDDDLVFKLVVICMSTIHLLQIRGSKQVTAATAFLLALFSHILNHVVIRLHNALYEKENPNKLLHHQEEEEAAGEDDMSDIDVEEQGPSNGPSDNPSQYHNTDGWTSGAGHNGETKEEQGDSNKKNNIKNLKRRRQRRRRGGSDSSDLSDVSDLSEGGRDLSDQFLSDESEEEFVGFFTNDSDSDISDDLMESQELEPGFASKSPSNSAKPTPDSSMSNLNAKPTPDSSMSNLNANNLDLMSSQTNIWSADSDSLAHLSSELLSSSMTLLGQNFRLEAQNSRITEKDEAELANCEEVVQGRKEVPVPPGFASSSEAKHVAEITCKMANFVIETDTEVSAGPTDTEMSGCDGSTTEAEDPGSLSDSTDKAELEHRQLQNLIDVLQTEGLLPVVKVGCDWMKCNKEVILTCAQSSQSLWHRLSVLLNILPKESVIAGHDQCWVDQLKTTLNCAGHPDWRQTFPLTEDINLWQFSPLTEAHMGIEFTSKRRGQLSDTQECFLRTGSLRHFGYYLSSLENLTFIYNEDQSLFIGPSHAGNVEENEKEAMDREADEESRRNQLMRDMAQLRLQAEVSQLEGSLEAPDTPHFPPYLIPDTTCLCDNLHLVKQLTQSGKGILIIPISVIDTLDYLKKESVGAREAIRWLESEFRKGNRYIRAQKSNEKVADNMPKNLKKNNRDLWSLYEILSCARYLAQQGENISSGHMVAVLSSKDLIRTSTPPTFQKSLSNCQQDGISIEKISTFTSKWLDTLKSNG
ncbi:nonsense-mediated mRNA decay factor SMG5-like isoform X2 [Ostrea edulis]|uniref:nonsense-mediated mRNA decay factor SMG5-like isoform X2 n=1 Tax=Ostrea edulis TaxID=37623 RepID=UPI002095746B|nr:nonsense-mediated mRNA decay factor SMG5-like isoform X2 [Ostrea edulis]